MSEPASESQDRFHYRGDHPAPCTPAPGNCTVEEHWVDSPPSHKDRMQRREAEEKRAGEIERADNAVLDVVIKATIGRGKLRVRQDGRRELQECLTGLRLLPMFRDHAPPPSVAAHEFGGIERDAAKILERLGWAKCTEEEPLLVYDERHGPPYIWNELAFEANLYAEKHGGFPDIPPDVVANTFDDPEAESDERLDYHGREKLKAVVDGLVLLYRCASSARESADALKGTQRPRSLDHAARDFAVRKLIEVYPKVFDKRFGISRGGREAHGPGVRFIQACLKALGRSISPRAIRRVWEEPLNP